MDRSRTGSQASMRRALFITGATGTLGSAFARICTMRHIDYYAPTRQALDITHQGAIAARIEQVQPWAVINTAGYVRVDDAEQDAERCYAINTIGAATLAAVCAERQIRYLTFSSDLVFDGRQLTPYLERDQVAPLNVYGSSKAEAEQRVQMLHPDALVVRTSAFFGPWDRYNFVTQTLCQLAAGEQVLAADDAVISPTYVPDLVNASLDLLFDNAHGLWHLANHGATSWAKLARTVAQLAGYDPAQVASCPTCALNLAAQRPLYSVLASERGLRLRSLDEALAAYWQDREEQ
jgi:dTDP-4-dehydrorhamnose reductase